MGVIDPAASSAAPSGKMRSVEALRAVAKVDGITKGERTVLYVLSEHAGQGERGLECHPSIKTIAEKAHISTRQATRVVHSLRAKGIIAFEDNAGGKQSNRYVLLFATPDMTPDKTTPDISDRENVTPDTLSMTPDISNVTPDKRSTSPLTKQSVTPDTAMSYEGFGWFEGKSEWKEQWGKQNLSSNCSFDVPNLLFGKPVQDHSSNPSRFRHQDDIISEVEEFEKKPEELMRAILNGITLTRVEKCDNKGHGTFVRPGYRFGNWIAWAGREEPYGDNWWDAGCQHCKTEYEELLRGDLKGRPSIPIRKFELATPASCPDHGCFILWAQISEFSALYEELIGSKFRVSLSRADMGCPGCEAEWLYDGQVQHDLQLTNEEWARGGHEIMEAIRYARGEPCERTHGELVRRATPATSRCV